MKQQLYNWIYRIEGRIESSAGVSEKILLRIAEATGVDSDWLLDSSVSEDAPLFVSDTMVGLEQHGLTQPLIKGESGSSQSHDRVA